MVISGNTVTVLYPFTTYDDNRDRITSYTQEIVQNVLVVPYATQDVVANEHFDGTKAQFTLGFPKGYSHSLRGCRVILPAPWDTTVEIIGDPQPNDPQNCPTTWWYTANAQEFEG